MERLHDREERLVRTNRPTHEPRHRKSGPPRVGGSTAGGRRARDLGDVDALEPSADFEDVEEERSA